MCVYMHVSIVGGGVQSEKLQLQFMSGAPSLIGRENNKEKNLTVIWKRQTRTKRFAETKQNKHSKKGTV